MARSRARMREVAHEWREVAHELRKVAHECREVAQRMREVAHECREVAQGRGKAGPNEGSRPAEGGRRARVGEDPETTREEGAEVTDGEARDVRCGGTAIGR